MGGVWRSGLTKIYAPISQHFSGLIFAQISDPITSGSYLLCNRIFSIFATFSNITMNAKLPIIAQLRSRGDYKEAVMVIKKFL